MLRTIGLLVLSNCFMTYAWYGHLKNTQTPLWKTILLCWLIAFFEYCLMVPANRNGYLHGMTGFQLKITQEVIALFVFVLFAIIYLKEPFELKYLISMLFIVGAVYFAFKK
ncbi:MAG TPA: DMT family protein [Sediminibacterium sp.]